MLSVIDLKKTFAELQKNNSTRIWMEDKNTQQYESWRKLFIQNVWLTESHVQ